MGYYKGRSAKSWQEAALMTIGGGWFLFLFAFVLNIFFLGEGMIKLLGLAIAQHIIIETGGIIFCINVKKAQSADGSVANYIRKKYAAIGCLSESVMVLMSMIIFILVFPDWIIISASLCCGVAFCCLLAMSILFVQSAKLRKKVVE